MRDVLRLKLLDAQAFLEEERFALAIKQYKDALDIAKKNDAEEYHCLNFLAMAYDDADDVESAVKHFKQALAVAEKVFGVMSRQFACSQNNLAMVHSNRLACELAEPLLDDAVDILQSLNDSNIHELDDDVLSHSSEVFANAADCKAKLGKMDQAIQLMEEGYKEAKKRLPLVHPKRLQYILELGAILDMNGQRKRASALQNEARNIMNRKDVDPFQSLAILQQAQRNVSIMFETFGLGVAPFHPKRKKSSGKEAPNVVRFTPRKPKKKSAAKTAVESPPPAGYQLKIALKNVTPEIWRRIVIPSDWPLNKVHKTIQRAMGWHDSHLHEFRIKGKRYSNPSDISDAKDERSYSLADFNFSVGSRFDYAYDFGDGWEHSIRIEKGLNENDMDQAVMFMDAHGACPPEDCGGPYGFMNLREQLKQGNSDVLGDWLDEYDPEEVPEVFQEPKPKAKKSKKSLTKVP